MKASVKSVRLASLVAMSFGFALLGIASWLLFGQYAYAQYSQPVQFASPVTGTLSTQEPRGFPDNSPRLVRNPKQGEYFAIIQIPALGKNWQRGVSEGTTDDVLDRLGIGHYESTPFPDAEGNFSLAGHSGNRWMPFNKLNSVKKGDRIYVKTLDAEYEYVVRNIRLVKPTQVHVIQDIPKSFNNANTKNWITLTTCEEVEGEDLRLIVHGELEKKDQFLMALKLTIPNAGRLALADQI